jgi:hypothetical protein
MLSLGRVLRIALTEDWSEPSATQPMFSLSDDSSGA